jgi:hypothetical protein
MDLKDFECCTEMATQITMYEALPGLLAPAFKPRLRDAAIIWYVDNEAAVGALVKASSSALDIKRVVDHAHILWANRGFLVWVERVASVSNIVEGISRDGIADAVARSITTDLCIIKDVDLKSYVQKSLVSVLQS